MKFGGGASSSNRTFNRLLRLATVAGVVTQAPGGAGVLIGKEFVLFSGLSGVLSSGLASESSTCESEFDLPLEVFFGF